MNKKRTLTAKVLGSSSKAAHLMGRVKAVSKEAPAREFKMTDRDYRVQ